MITITSLRNVIVKAVSSEKMGIQLTAQVDKIKLLILRSMI